MPMRIGMLVYDMQDFGGLEEYVVNLAAGLQAEGHAVSVICAARVPPQNQYARRLAEQTIPLFQPPAWVSQLASDWLTKEKILQRVMGVLRPFTLLPGLALAFARKQPVRQGWESAQNWLKGRLMDKLIGPDYRKPLGQILLGWWMRRWHPDLLHIQGYTTSLLFAIEWAGRRKMPVVYEEHQTPDPHFNWWQGFEASINRADRVIAVSEKSAEGLREVCGVTRPIEIIGPLLADPFHPGWKKKIRPYDPDKPFIVTTVARLYITKGLTFLLDAAALVKKNHPNIEFRVYGDGDLRDELMEKAKRLDLDGEAIFRGIFRDRAELTQILEETDIFLLSSILEGQPLVIAEAMAHGCPIVSTNVGGIPELICDGENGLLCPPEDPQCLAGNIMRLAPDAGMRQRLGSAARLGYENGPFKAEALSRKLISVYEEVLKEHKPAGRASGKVL